MYIKVYIFEMEMSRRIHFDINLPKLLFFGGEKWYKKKKKKKKKTFFGSIIFERAKKDFCRMDFPFLFI